MDLTPFAADVGAEGPVTITGMGTRGGPCPGVRVVSAPSGIERIEPAEMTVVCGAGTPVDELTEALGEVRQTVSLPGGGTVGGALAIGHSGLRLLGDGPIRNAVLQIQYVSASGAVVKAGGPTVKNVSGFDLCRLFVGSRGTLGFIGSVILRTRPLARHAAWFSVDLDDPTDLQARLFRPVSLLWNGTTAWVLLEGHPDDVAAQARACALRPVDGPPSLPAHRTVLPWARCSRVTGQFVALVGTGVVFTSEPVAAPAPTDRLAALTGAVKARFDPSGRLNPSR